MPPSLKSIPPNVFLIADHLDAILASAEELAALRIAVAGANRSDGAEAPDVSLRASVDRVRALEMSILSRALQARARARELKHPHAQIKLLMSMFVSGTAALADAVEEFADKRYVDFQTGDCPVAYLMSRGLIMADRGSLSGVVEIEVGEEFLVAKRIALGPLMDLTAQFLNSLAACYDLFRSEASLNALSDDLDRAASAGAKETHTRL